MLIPRSIHRRVEYLLSRFPVIILTGARQSGKTTLAREFFPGLHYVSLELPSIASQAENEPRLFLDKNPPPLIVDEIQYAPGIFRHIKIAVDEKRDEMGRFLLTGSQNFVLMKNVSDSLAGRCAIVELENLMLPEITEYIESDIQENRKTWNDGSLLKQIILRGQFPELWRRPEIPEFEYYAAYLATYLERDVRQIMNVTSLRDFERFIRILAARSGNILNRSQIASEVGVSSKAIGDWLSVLQASGQIILLEPWFQNFNKRIVKSPKVYFRDSGLLCFLLGLDHTNWLQSPFLGAIWETFLFAELRKRNGCRKKPVNFWFYRDQRSREIDFIIEHGGRLKFVEVKWSEHPNRADSTHISTVSEELKESSSPWKPADRHFILANSSTPYPVRDNITAVGPAEIDSIFE